MHTCVYTYALTCPCMHRYSGCVACSWVFALFCPLKKFTMNSSEKGGVLCSSCSKLSISPFVAKRRSVLLEISLQVCRDQNVLYLILVFRMKIWFLRILLVKIWKTQEILRKGRKTRRQLRMNEEVTEDRKWHISSPMSKALHLAL